MHIQMFLQRHMLFMSTFLFMRNLWGPFNYNPVISHFGFKALAELFKSLCENSLANLLEWLAVAAPHVRIQRSMGLDNSESRIQPKAQT